MQATWEECNDPYELLRRSRSYLKQERFRWLAAEYLEQVNFTRFGYTRSEALWIDLLTEWFRGERPDPTYLMTVWGDHLHRRSNNAITHAADTIIESLSSKDFASVAAHACIVAADNYPQYEPFITESHRPKSKAKFSAYQKAEHKRRELWNRTKEDLGNSIKETFCNCFRDVAGNPFEPVIFDPSWRTDTVMALARGIHAEAAFDRMPILADAMEEAGCHHPAILSHCRSQQHHVRGCWVIAELFEDKWESFPVA